ncbi:MAG TPA: DNRLRE domain-containing protein [Candidatus Thermoplasmatota archaeon]|nr:DNRLRE domain-containing protein [Candidatus Thermoplasmatota archaeon]
MKLSFVPLALIALLLAGAGVALAGEASTKWVVVDPAEQAGGTDTFVDASKPFENYGNRDSLEVSADPTAYALLNFPLAAAFPKNATLLSAHLMLTQIDLEGNPLGTESIRLTRVTGPWSELGVNYTNRPELGELLAQLSPKNGQLATYNFTVTEAVRRARDDIVNGTAPFYGFGVTASRRDVPGIPSDTFQARFVFSSSNRTQAERFLRPQLALFFELNGPRLQNLTVNGRAMGSFTENRSAAFQVEAFDPRGEVSEVRVQLKNETGVVKHAFSLKPTERYNTSQGAGKPPAILDPARQYRYWEGNHTIPYSTLRTYRVDVEAVDNDGVRVNVTTAKGWIARVDRALPTLENVKATPSKLNESEAVNLTVRVGDNEGIENVTLIVTAGVETLAKIPMKPLLARPYVNDTYFANFTLDEPGLYALRVLARDRSNGENLSNARDVQVLDITPPLLGGTSATGPRGTAFDEAGTLVTFRVQITDASPVTVTFNLTSPLGESTLTPVEKRADGTYAASFTLDEVGEWTGRFTARDAAGNEASSVVIPFGISSAAPPLFLWATTPPPGPYVNATPVLELRVLDPNLDPESVAVLLTVDGVPRQDAAMRTSPTPGGLSLRFTPVFAVGEEVALTVEAADRLGSRGTGAYVFRVDRAPPATFLSLDPALGLNDTAYRVSAATRYTLEAQDTGSGVKQTWWRLGSEHPAVRRAYTGPFTITPGALAEDVLLFWSEDKAGNVERAQTLTLLYAKNPPAVTARLEAGILVGTVAPGTPGVGLKNVTVLTRATGTGPWTPVPAALTTNRTTQAVAFRAPLPTLGSGTVLEYAVHAVDVLSVETFPLRAPVPLGETVEGNHAPTGGIVAPEPGEQVKGVVTVRWAFNDMDGDRLRVKAAVRGTYLAETLLLTDRGEAAGSARWDTTTWPNGHYEVVLTVQDAGPTPLTVTRLVQVENPGGGALLASPLTLTGGTDTVFTVKARANADVATLHIVFVGPQEVRARLYDDGQHGDNRSGDGLYAGTVALPEEGSYTGALEVLTRNGQPLISEARVEATVQGGSLTPAPGLMLVAAALVVGAIVRRRLR